MTFDSHLALGAAAAAIIATALIPLITWLPASIERQWRLDCEASNQLNEQPIAPPGWLERSVFVALGLLLGMLCVQRFGATWPGAAWTGYFLVLLLLAAINTRSTMLPDRVVLPTLWAGLLWHAQAGSAAEHVQGAALAYLAPWLLATLFSRLTGRWVIGHGDLKAFAMAGAWVGLGNVGHLFVFFLLGLAAEVVLLLLVRKGARGAHPSGPAHLFASLAIVLGATPWPVAG
jgi:leader peptidase (prepilin peptidase) / N-methyltransferase